MRLTPFGTGDTTPPSLKLATEEGEIVRRLALGTGALAHAALHLGYIAPPPENGDSPFSRETSWLLPAGSETVVGLSLATVAIVAFSLLALAAWGVRPLRFAWRPLIGIGALSSLALLIVFWNPWLIVGVLINATALILTFAVPDWWDRWIG